MPDALVFGAPDCSPLGPVGGGGGYQGDVPRWDHYVSAREELHAALQDAKPGEVVYVANGTEIDMTVWVRACGKKIVVPAGGNACQWTRPGRNPGRAYIQRRVRHQPVDPGRRRERTDQWPTGARSR